MSKRIDALRALVEENAQLRSMVRTMRAAIDDLEGALMGWPELIDFPARWEGVENTADIVGSDNRLRPNIRVHVNATAGQVYRVCDALVEHTRIINSDEYVLKEPTPSGS